MNRPFKSRYSNFVRKRKASKRLKSYTRLNIDGFFDEFCSHLGASLAEICRMKLLHNKFKKYKYSSYQKFVSANLLVGTSSSGYNFLGNSIMSLPSPLTIRRTLRKVSQTPGIKEKNGISLKVKVNPRCFSDRQTFLLMDEISLRKGFAYDRKSDLIFGFTDDGHNRTSNIASSAMCIMAVGVLRKWKFPPSYYFTESVMKAEAIIRVREEAIKVVEDQGFEVLGVTTDQGSNFDRSFRLLGLRKGEGKICVNGKEYFLMRDVPHLLKSARNFLEKCDVVIPEYDEPAKWSHLQQFHELEVKRSYKFAPRVGENHIYNLRFGNRMKVKLAAQVLSNSVSSAMDYLVTTGDLDSGAVATSTYLKKFNDLFDCLNSSLSSDDVFYRRPLKCGSDTSEFLKSSYKWLEGLEKLNRGRKPKFISGWMSSIKSVLGISEYLNSNGFKYLATRRLCQDPLEAHFGKIRSISKFPDPYAFSNSYAKPSTASLIMADPNNSNVETKDEHICSTIGLLTEVS